MPPLIRQIRNLTLFEIWNAHNKALRQTDPPQPLWPPIVDDNWTLLGDEFLDEVCGGHIRHINLQKQQFWERVQYVYEDSPCNDIFGNGVLVYPGKLRVGIPDLHQFTRVEKTTQTARRMPPAPEG